MIRSTLAALTKQIMGRVRRRTSTKHRSMTLVVRSLRQRRRGCSQGFQSTAQARNRFDNRHFQGKSPPNQKGRSVSQIKEGNGLDTAKVTPTPSCRPETAWQRQPPYAWASSVEYWKTTKQQNPVSI